MIVHSGVVESTKKWNRHMYVLGEPIENLAQKVK